MTGVWLGALTGVVATIAVALASPGLYADWGAIPGALVVIPAATVGLTLLATLPLLARRRLTRGAVVAAIATAVLVGELTFLGSQGTAFARWNASRHWAESERKAAAAREASERETCRRLLAEQAPPPPPVPEVSPGGIVASSHPRSFDPESGTLVRFSRSRCRELLERAGH